MRLRPLLLLAAPVAVLAVAVLCVRLDAARAREGLAAPDAVGWSIGGKPARVDVRRVIDGEVERFEIAVLSGDDEIHRAAFAIDHDLFGGGFVGGLDLDGDGVPSLVLATRDGRQLSRSIEPGPAGVLERSFDERSDGDWAQVRARLDLVAPGPWAMLSVAAGFIWLLVGAAVYAVIGLRALVTWTVRLRRERP